MAYETKDNSGSIFANEKKESANQPDGKGSAMIDGVEYWVSCWLKKTQEGKPWRSYSYQRKDAAQGQQKAPARAQSRPAPPDHDIPFRDCLAQRGLHLAV